MLTHRKQILPAVLILLLWIPLNAQDSTWFNFGGYMRSGFGVSRNAGSMEAFMAPYAEAKYRLGNEAETYIEPVFTYSMKNEEGVLFETNLRVAMIAPTSSSSSFTTETSAREAFVRVAGLSKKQANLTFWAGQRYYNWRDVHMIDYFPFDMSGLGGGFENLQLGGIGKLDVALMGGSSDKLSRNGTVRPRDAFYLNKTTLDITLREIPVGLGTLGLILDLSYFKGDEVNTPVGTYEVNHSGGWSGNMYHTLPFQGGRNILYLFYGSGAAENGRTIIQTPIGLEALPGEVIEVSGFRRVRVVNDLMVDFGPHFSLMSVLLYQRVDNNNPDNNIMDWYSAGIRPVYFINRYFSIALELGVDHTIQEGMMDGNLIKATLAPQITPLNKLLQRPALRAFITYARWSDSFMGEVAPINFGGQTNGMNFGLQMEVWW